MHKEVRQLPPSPRPRQVPHEEDVQHELYVLEIRLSGLVQVHVPPPRQRRGGSRPSQGETRAARACAPRDEQQPCTLQAHRDEEGMNTFNTTRHVTIASYTSKVDDFSK